MIRRIPLRSLAVASLILAAAACGDDDASSSSTTPETSVKPTEPTTPAPDTTSPDTTAPPDTSDAGNQDSTSDAASADAAIQDLAERLSVEVSAITVKTTEAVTWRDGSMGCPQPDLMYTQALVPGRRLVLTVDGADYAYHGGQTGEYFFCENPAADPTVPGDS